MSFLQQQFLTLAFEEYGDHKGNMPSEAKRHL